MFTDCAHKVYSETVIETVLIVNNDKRLQTSDGILKWCVKRKSLEHVK